MRRRDFLRSAGAGVTGLSLGIRGARAAEQRPNIIFLLTDDQRWDTLGCMGNPIIQTPNLDRLGNNGVIFENSYVTTSICYASRASILTGQYNRRHNINSFNQDLTDAEFARTYPGLMREAGYLTAFIGKFGVGAEALPEDKFDYWKGWPGQGKYENKDENGNYKHLTRIIGDQALEFLDGCSGEKPFCLSISFKAAHAQDGDPRQFISDPAYDDLYADVTIPPARTSDPKYWESFPDFFKADNEARRRWELRFSTPELYQRMMKNHYRLIYGVDVVVGDMMKKLKDEGLADNTVIVFTGDNGFYLGEHGMAGKWYGHEESIRVPLLVFDPRAPEGLRGQRRKEMALNIDIAPTLLGLAGVSTPKVMQGNDLGPLLKGESPEWRSDFFYEHFFEHARIPRSEGVVDKRYKYLVYIDQDPVYEELYDLQEDPRETNNLAKNPEHQGILKRMRRRHRELRKAAG